MYIGILVPFMNNFGQKGFYHSQEIGLGKALCKKNNRVVIYKLIKEGMSIPEDTTIGGVLVKYFPAKAIGINGIVRTQWIDSELDALICFADLQITIPAIYKWCIKNKIVFIPYIGVTCSHSTNYFVRKIMNILFQRNIRIYKKSECLAKNIKVCEDLTKLGCKNVNIAPVGIDLDNLNDKFENTSIETLKQKYGYCCNDKVILFIGRLEEEKRPVELVRYFYKIYKNDPNYRLLIVGKGVLKTQMKQEIVSNDLSNVVNYFEQIPNEFIWELYRICDCFINLNMQEIFGMVILEAMFYKVKVIAWHAPGPDYIIDDGVTGFLVNNEQELFEAVFAEAETIKCAAHKKVISSFTWDQTAFTVLNILNR